MAIDLRNDTSQYLQIELPHAEVCKKSGVCLCSKTGAPMTIHLAPQSWTLGVPDAALLCAELKALIAQRKVLLKHKKSAAAVQVQKPIARKGAKAPKTSKE